MSDWNSKAVDVVRDARCFARKAPTFLANVPLTVESLNRFFSEALPSQVLKDDRTTSVVKLENSKNGASFVLKRYNARNRWHTIKRALRQSRASLCWNMSFEFMRVGLNVSEPLMMYEDRFYGLCKDAYFANRLLIGDELLSKLPAMNKAEQASVRSAVLAAFKVLKQARISHGDMKATNLLWVEGALFFIDLDAARKHPWWSLTWRKAHAKDKKRFLKNWRDKPELLSLFTELT